MKLLVTGAAGHIGAYFLKRHYASYPDLVCLDQDVPEDGTLPEIGEWLYGRLDDPNFAKKAVAGVDKILHLAADPSPSAEMESLVPNNIITTYNVFQTALEAGVKRIVYASSVQAVRGYPEDVVVQPDMPPRPASLYGATKAWGEAMCSVY